MKAVVAAFNQEKALVGAFSVITNLRMELFEALDNISPSVQVYNLGTPDYYAVAVVKIRDNSSELIYLKRRNSCHTGVGQVWRIWQIFFHSSLKIFL